MAHDLFQDGFVFTPPGGIDQTKKLDVRRSDIFQVLSPARWYIDRRARFNRRDMAINRQLPRSSKKVIDLGRGENMLFRSMPRAELPVGKTIPKVELVLRWVENLPQARMVAGQKFRTIRRCDFKQGHAPFPR